MLITFDSGRELWAGSHEVRRTDGERLPSRREVRKQADREALEALKNIRAQHIREFRKPWPGMEFGKSHLGQAINRAIADVSKKLGTARSSGVGFKSPSTKGD